MCAFNEGRDSCGGDSGGPLLLKGSSIDDDQLVGIVSWGISCANDDYPGVYSRISYYYDWIQSTICNERNGSANSDGLPYGITCDDTTSSGSSPTTPVSSTTQSPVASPTGSSPTYEYEGTGDWASTAKELWDEAVSFVTSLLCN